MHMTFFSELDAGDAAGIESLAAPSHEAWQNIAEPSPEDIAHGIT